jgi:hypothetical protein
MNSADSLLFDYKVLKEHSNYILTLKKLVTW